MTSKGYKKTVRIVRKGNGLHANEKKKCLINLMKLLRLCRYNSNIFIAYIYLYLSIFIKINLYRQILKVDLCII